MEIYIEYYIIKHLLSRTYTERNLILSLDYTLEEISVCIDTNEIWKPLYVL